ncbi:ABC transporter permease [Parafilimonas sp.]|uniref:ABC transporter permease n=1 Tax=Parafilimonas sp. TaxID=1969739 RepID=UPI0039E6CD0F
MFKNYFKTTWRYLWKDRLFTLLNLTGLASGLACALLIYLWTSDELQVDKFNQKDDRLYQVMQNIPDDAAGMQTIEHTQGILASSLQQDMPEVAYAASVVPASWFTSKGILSVGDTHIRSDEEYVSKDFFNVFSVTLINGNKNELLPDANAVVISDALADKLFHGNKDIIGKTIDWTNEGAGTDLSGNFHITGVFKSLPSTSSIKSDLLFNYELFLKSRPNLLKWGNSDPNTYVLLKPGNDVSKFNEKLKNYIAQKLNIPKNSKDYADANTLFAQRFSDRYLHGSYENGQAAGGRMMYVKLFSLIALFIMLIACVNFMNLSTARASRRLKEVGVRKVIGATKKSLVLQYLGESVIMAFLSLLFAVVLMLIILPQFNLITGKQLSLHVDASQILAVLSVTLLTGFIAGSYPALYLSGFNPITVLAGKLPSSFSELLVRKGLVVFQFAISVVFIISVIVIYNQMNLVHTKNLGYSRDNIITFKKEGQLKTNMQPFLAEVRKIPGVVNASSSFGDLLGKHGTTTEVLWKTKKPDEQVEFSGMYVGDNWIETAGLHIIDGRSFDAKFGADSTNVIFNEAAVKAMGMTNPVGQPVILFGKRKTIIGVVKDFNFESLYQDIKPCFITTFQDGSNILVKIKRNNEAVTITKLQDLYRQYNPGVPFDYSFLDADYNALYASEQRVAVLSKYFAGLAILISCLGLFGLATFTAKRKQKEIGIRKVMGASAANITGMLSVEFLKLVAIAILVAFPVSWWMMHNWLQGFAYRVSISPLVFFIAGLSVLMITLITISFQSLRAAIANPVKSLRTE